MTLVVGKQCRCQMEAMQVPDIRAKMRISDWSIVDYTVHDIDFTIHDIM